MTPGLTAFLSGHPAARRPLAAPRPLTGGLSGAELWRFESASGPLVARAWPITMTAERLAAIHDWLSTASGLSFIAVPLADLKGRTASEHGGRLWELQPWLRGSPGPPERARVEAAFRGLGALHALFAFARMEGQSTGLAQRADELRGLLQEGLYRIEGGAIKSFGVAGREWLSRARALAPPLLEATTRAARRIVPLQPCLRDARPDHFLFDGERLSGLVDYGAMGIETVAADLARLIGEWFPGDRPLKGIALAAYDGVRPLATSETALIDVFERSSGLLIGAHWLTSAPSALALERLRLSLRTLRGA